MISIKIYEYVDYIYFYNLFIFNYSILFIAYPFFYAS